MKGRTFRYGRGRGGGRITPPIATATPASRNTTSPAPSSANAKARAGGRLRAVVSIRLTTKTIEALDALARHREKSSTAYYYRRPSRSDLIIEAIDELLKANRRGAS